MSLSEIPRAPATAVTSFALRSACFGVKPAKKVGAKMVIFAEPSDFVLSKTEKDSYLDIIFFREAVRWRDLMEA